MKTFGNFDIEKNTIYQLDQGYEHLKIGNNESKNSQGWNFNYLRERSPFTGCIIITHLI